MSQALAKQPRRPASAPPPSPYQIMRAMEALAEARERLLMLEPDMPESDQRLYADMLDGESGDAFDVIDRVIAAALDASDLADAATARAKALGERRTRFDRRERMLRSVAQQMMEALDLSKIERPDFTLSLRPGVPHVVVTDETQLPDAYVRVERKPDKGLILASLKAGQEVPGAALSNTGTSLSVRTA